MAEGSSSSKTASRGREETRGKERKNGTSTNRSRSPFVKAEDYKEMSGTVQLSRFKSFENKGANRSASRTRAENGDEVRDDGEKKSGGFFRGRSSSRQRNKGERGERSRSRGPFGFLRNRSLSRNRKKKNKEKSDEDRGRAKNGYKLPPSGYNTKIAEEKKVEKEKSTKDEEEEVDVAIDKLLAERQLLAEVEAQKSIPEPIKSEARHGIESLGDDDVMQLDERNTTMHVACLLHHSSTVILERLENEPELAKLSNNANETPLHYAAMDKKGVNKDVLKTLIQLNPDAVKQPNVQNSLPIHLACMAGAPSSYAVKTFLKMYPKATMMQSDFPLLFEEDMVDTTKDEDEESDDGSQFVTYRPKNVTAVSGIASMFACAAPNQAAIELANERARRKQERSKSRYDHNDEEGPKVETGFSPLHLAVMNSASTSVIDMLIKVNPRSIYLKTSQGRTALDCAQYIVRQHWLYGSDDEDAIQNTFGAIERLEEAFQGK